MQSLVKAVQSLSYYLGRFLDPKLGSQEAIRQTLQACSAAFRTATATEALRLCGFPRASAAEIVSHAGKRIWDGVVCVIKYFQRESLDATSSTPNPKLPWDFDLLWVDSPPRHLMQLRPAVSPFVNDKDSVAARSLFRSRSRPSAYREQVKKELYQHLELVPCANIVETVERCIDTRVALSRRDSRFDPCDAVPCGFASGRDGSFALFRTTGTSEIFAVPEWCTKSLAADWFPGARRYSDTFAPIRIPVASTSESSLILSGGQTVRAAVAFSQPVQSAS